MTGEEEQIGGFDLIYRNNKRIKNGVKHLSFLGCLNNRHQQMRKMAKAVALRLAEKVKEDKAREKSREEKKDNNRNIRNRSINAPQTQFKPPNSNTALVNKAGNTIRKPEGFGQVKLPKVSAVGNSSVSNTSMKAIL